VLDDYYFDKIGMEEEEKYEELSECLKKIKRKKDCLFFMDILLNHTSSDSNWLNDDDEAYYSCSNTPHLNSAFKLDSFLHSFSQ
jgi:glycogen debranching enzyme